MLSSSSVPVYYLRRGCTIVDGLSVGHNVSGVWIYRLDSCSEGPPRNDRARCHTWLQSDRVREQPQVSQADSLLPPCPCNTVQVAMDTNFVQSRTESNCYFFHPPPVNTNYTRVGVQY